MPTIICQELFVFGQSKSSMSKGWRNTPPALEKDFTLRQDCLEAAAEAAATATHTQRRATKDASVTRRPKDPKRCCSSTHRAATLKESAMCNSSPFIIAARVSKHP